MTPREHRALAFIESYIADTGYPPAFHEIQNHLALAGKSGVHRLLCSLEQQGRIARIRAKPRAITVLVGVAATGARAIADILSAVPTDALRTELTRREETR